MTRAPIDICVLCGEPESAHHDFESETEVALTAEPRPVSLNSEHSSFDDQVLTSTYARSIPTAKVAAERMAREWVRRQCEAFGMEVKDGD